MEQPVHLKRSLGLGLVTCFGLGNILGAGIYVLVGKVAGLAGLYAPLAFVVASIVAGFSGLSYAELSSRLPFSAGESIYVFRAFKRRWLALTVGFLIAAAGIVSTATISRGFAGYLNVFIPVPDSLAIIMLMLSVGGLAAYGIGESVRVAAVFTVVEIFGLLLVVMVGSDAFLQLPGRWPELLPSLETDSWIGIIGGAFLAFYAYIGFEDMVNVAEEVQEPQRNLPLAIILALVISSVLYLLVALTAVLNVAPEQLAASDAPLALVYITITGHNATVITQIALFAVVNGAIVQVIMVSRILYGMSRQGWVWAGFGRVHSGRRTPLVATAAVTLVILVLALFLPLLALARSTSFLILIVFVLINLALLILKRRQPQVPGVTVFPVWIPVCGFVSSSTLLAIEVVRPLLTN